jgi:L-threonylcarbamoyladenylate synthase
LATISTDINHAKSYLEQGYNIGIPTETVYGLAANALDKNAVAKIFEIKNRPTFDPLIVHCATIYEIEKYIIDFPKPLQDLANTFMPGALTLLLPKNEKIPSIVCAGLDKIAFRIPNHPITLALLKELNFPLAAPSANPFGYISPTTAQHVEKQLGNQIPYILDGGKCEIGLESTIVSLENQKLVVHRLGGLSIEELEKTGIEISIQINQSSNPVAPGQIQSHYAPKKPILIGNITELIYKNKDKKIGVLSFGNMNYGNIELNLNLSKNANYKEAASNLFDYMRQLDESEIDIILTEYLPTKGLGIAINDRLKRAAAK